MRAITLYQPWASLIAAGVKDRETRSWPPPQYLVGQRIAIHAGLRVEADVPETFDAEVAHHLGAAWRSTVPRGAVVAIVRLSGWAATGELVRQGLVDAWGDYSPGRYAWLLREIEPLDPPAYVRGQRGIWEWDAGARGPAPEGVQGGLL